MQFQNLKSVPGQTAPCLAKVELDFGFTLVVTPLINWKSPNVEEVWSKISLSLATIGHVQVIIANISYINIKYRAEGFAKWAQKEEFSNITFEIS